MSLIDPTPGQLIDRRAVLALKIPQWDRRGRKADHLRREYAAIEERLGLLDGGKGPVLTEEQRDRLDEIHARMWHHVGWIEATSAATPENAMSVAQVAIDLANLNRERWKLVDDIDRANGAHQGGEKL